MSKRPQVSSAGTGDPLQVQQSGSRVGLRLVYGIKKEEGENGMKEDKPKISICAPLLLDKLSSFPICQR